MRNEIFYAIWINKDVTVISDCTLPMWAGESEEKNTCHLAAIRLLPLPAVTPHGELWGNWMWKHKISSVQSLSHVPIFATPWTAARLPCTSPTPRAYSKSCQLSQWCHPTISSSFIRVFSSESVLCIRRPKYWSFSISISPSNEYSGLISFRMNWLDFLAVQGTLKSLLQHHSSKASILGHSAFFIVQLSHPYMTTGKTIPLTIQTFVGKVMSLLFHMLSRLVIAFLPRSKYL